MDTKGQRKQNEVDQWLLEQNALRSAPQVVGSNVFTFKVLPQRRPLLHDEEVSMDHLLSLRSQKSTSN